MSLAIAACIDKNGETTTLMEPCNITVYSKEAGRWTLTKEMDFEIDVNNGLKGVRDRLAALADSMGDCKIFVGKSVTGAAYTVLESKGFNIWEIEGKPEEFLYYVLEKEEEQEIAKPQVPAEPVIKAAPVLKDKAGHYFINLKELQENKSVVTSKQALQPFLRNKCFSQLEIICTHVPPWLEGELQSLQLKFLYTKLEENKIKVMVYPVK